MLLRPFMERELQTKLEADCTTDYLGSAEEWLSCEGSAPGIQQGKGKVLSTPDPSSVDSGHDPGAVTVDVQFVQLGGGLRGPQEVQPTRPARGPQEKELNEEVGGSHGQDSTRSSDESAEMRGGDSEKSCDPSGVLNLQPSIIRTGLLTNNKFSENKNSRLPSTILVKSGMVPCVTAPVSIK